MAGKKKKSIYPQIFKIAGVILLSLVIGLIVFQQTQNFLLTAPYFTIKTIIIDPSLQFVAKKDIAYLNGENIFSVDLVETQQRLQRKYPEISDLKVVRKYPNQLRLVAKKREAIAQIQNGSRYLIVDDQGVYLGSSEQLNKELPVIDVEWIPTKLILGLPIASKHIKVAGKILKNFNEIKQLEKFKISDVNASNLSKISFTLKDDIQVYVDSTKIEKKMTVLKLVLLEANVDLAQVKYVDLRFKEPIIGKK